MRATVEPTRRGVTGSVWWLVFKHELTELWTGRRVLNFLVLFAILMSLTSFLLATNYQINLLPLQQGVDVALTAAITFGLFIGLIIAAESISGERERATLEPLLLTPAGHRQVVLGKFLAALTPWPAAYALSIPYLVTLAQHDSVLWPALIWGAVTGTVLAVAFIALGMLLSLWVESSRISLFIGLLTYAMLLVPSQLPAEFQRSPAGVAIAAIDPVEAVAQFLSRVLGDGQPVAIEWGYAVAPLVVTCLLLAVLFGRAARRIALEPRRSGSERSMPAVGPVPVRVP
jgi:ABC-type Na+ efflux pump permease subunit